MEIINIIIPIITLVIGGGATWIFTIKYTRRQAEAEAMEHFQTVYQGLIKDLQDDRAELRNRIGTMENKIKSLELVVENNAKILKQLSRLACVKAPSCPDCVLIDISQL